MTEKEIKEKTEYLLRSCKDTIRDYPHGNSQFEETFIEVIEFKDRQIVELETLCDPAGITGKNIFLEDQNKALQVKIAEEQADNKRLRELFEESTARIHKQSELLSQKADKSWRCFHCDEVFTSRQYAAEHFGFDEGATPACKISGHEGHLVTYIRKLEAELASYRAESDSITLAWFAKESEHVQAMLREEEKGFARGVADMQKHGYIISEPGTPDELRKAAESVLMEGRSVEKEWATHWLLDACKLANAYMAGVQKKESANAV